MGTAPGDLIGCFQQCKVLDFGCLFQCLGTGLAPAPAPQPSPMPAPNPNMCMAPDHSGVFEKCTLLYEDPTTCNYLCHDDDSLISVPKVIPIHPGIPAQGCEDFILVPVPEP